MKYIILLLLVAFFATGCQESQIISSEARNESPSIDVITNTTHPIVNNTQPLLNSSQVIIENETNNFENETVPIQTQQQTPPTVQNQHNTQNQQVVLEEQPPIIDNQPTPVEPEVNDEPQNELEAQSSITQIQTGEYKIVASYNQSDIFAIGLEITLDGSFVSDTSNAAIKPMQGDANQLEYAWIEVPTSIEFVLFIEGTIESGVLFLFDSNGNEHTITMELLS